MITRAEVMDWLAVFAAAAIGAALVVGGLAL